MTAEYILRAAIRSMEQGRRAHCHSAFVQGKGYVNRGELVEEKAAYIKSVVRAATSELENLDYANEYGEPGYDNPVKGILFANWNCFPRNIYRILEHYGYAIEWSDEWSICECGKAVRTSPDSWDWRPSYMIENDCELFCSECAADHVSDDTEDTSDSYL